MHHSRAHSSSAMMKKRQTQNNKKRPQKLSSKKQKLAKRLTTTINRSISSQAEIDTTKSMELYPHIAQLCKRHAVLSTTMNLLPTTERKPLTMATINRAQSSQPSSHSVDLFKIQDTANKLNKHAQSIDLTSEKGMIISQIVQKTVMDNIIPTQHNILQRNRIIVSSIPGAAFNNPYIAMNQQGQDISIFSNNNNNNTNDDDQSSDNAITPISVEPDELIQYQSQLEGLNSAKGLIQHCRQILSMKQQELYNLKQTRDTKHNKGSDAARPLHRTLTRLQLWQQNLNTIISSQQSTLVATPHINTLLQQTQPILNALLQNKKKILDLEQKMTKHVLNKVLPSIYSQMLRKTILHQKLLSPLRDTLDEWGNLIAPIPGTTTSNIPPSSLPPSAFTTVKKIQTQMEEFFTTLSSNTLAVNNNHNSNDNTDNNTNSSHKTPITKLISKQKPLTDTHLSQFKSESNDIEQFNTPKFKQLFTQAINSDDVYDNLSIQLTYLYKQEIELLPQFIPLAHELEELLDIPSFEFDKHLVLPQIASNQPKSSYHYHSQQNTSSNKSNDEKNKFHGSTSIQQQQQMNKFITQLHERTQNSAIDTFELNLLSKNMLLFYDTIRVIDQCTVSLTQSLPDNILQHFNNEQIKLKRNQEENNNNNNNNFSSLSNIMDDLHDYMLTPVDSTGEYVYAGRKWKDIATNNLYTHLTSYEQLQSHVVNFHTKQQTELEQLVEQQLVNSNRSEHQLKQHHNRNIVNPYSTNDPSYQLYHAKKEDEAMQQFINTATQIEEIHSQLAEIVQKPNTILAVQPIKRINVQDNNNNNINAADNNTSIEPGAVLDDFPLHKLKSKTKSTLLSQQQDITNINTIKNNKTVPPPPPPSSSSTTTMATKDVKKSKMVPRGEYSDELLTNNEQIHSLLDSHTRLVRTYETKNKSHALQYGRTLQPTMPYYTNAYALDIDGVLLKDGHLLPGVKESLSSLFPRSRGGSAEIAIPTVFMTNGGGVTEIEKAQELSHKFGLDIHPEQVIVASTPWHNLVPSLHDKNIAIIGGKKSPQVAKSYGFNKSFALNDLRESYCDLIAPQAVQDNPTKYGQRSNVRKVKKVLSDVDAVMIWTDPRDWYVDLQVTLDILIQSREKTANELNIPIGTYKSRQKTLLLDNYKDISENNHIESNSLSFLMSTAAAAAASTAIRSSPNNNIQLNQQQQQMMMMGMNNNIPFLHHHHNHNPTSITNDINSDIPSDYFNITQLYWNQYKPLHTPILLSNPDFIYSNRYDKPRLAQGSFAETLSYLYTRLTNEPLEFLTCGKPTTMTYRIAEGKLLQQAQDISMLIGGGNSATTTTTTANMNTSNTITTTGTRPVVINNIYGIGDNPAADIRGANWANSPWVSVFVHTGTIPLHHNNTLIDSHTTLNDGSPTSFINAQNSIDTQSHTPALEYPSICEAINELEMIHRNVAQHLTLKL